jgi:hypothetical protein
MTRSATRAPAGPATPIAVPPLLKMPAPMTVLIMMNCDSTPSVFKSGKVELQAMSLMPVDRDVQRSSILGGPACSYTISTSACGPFRGVNLP